MRTATVIYLILATLTGPRLCPCAVALPETTPSAPSTPLKGTPRFCGCCTPPGSTTRAATTVSQAPGEQRPAQPSAPCHCQCGKQDSTATSRIVGRVAKSCVDHAGFDAPVGGVSNAIPAPHVLSFSQLRDLPLCSTDDLLYAFHRLRC